MLFSMKIQPPVDRYNGEETSSRIIEKASDGILLTDEEGRIILWNKALETIIGLKRDEVLGRFFWDVQFELASGLYKTEEAFPSIVEGINNPAASM